MSDSDQREEAVSEAARHLEGAARMAYLDEACAGDPALRARRRSAKETLNKAQFSNFSLC